MKLITYSQSCKIPEVKRFKHIISTLIIWQHSTNHWMVPRTIQTNFFKRPWKLLWLSGGTLFFISKISEGQSHWCHRLIISTKRNCAAYQQFEFGQLNLLSRVSYIPINLRCWFVHSHEGQVQAADWCVMFKKVSGFVSRLCSGFAAFKLAVSPRNSTPQSHDLAFFFFFLLFKTTLLSVRGLFRLLEAAVWIGTRPTTRSTFITRAFCSVRKKKEKKRERIQKNSNIFAQTGYCTFIITWSG